MHSEKVTIKDVHFQISLNGWSEGLMVVLSKVYNISYQKTWFFSMNIIKYFCGAMVVRCFSNPMIWGWNSAKIFFFLSLCRQRKLFWFSVVTKICFLDKIQFPYPFKPFHEYSKIQIQDILTTRKSGPSWPFCRTFRFEELMIFTNSQQKKKFENRIKIDWIIT